MRVLNKIMPIEKDNLLKIIIEEYIDSASPVGSNLIVKKYLPNVSSATIRNYMVELEEKGLICQPHTSAGRIPTEEGYKYYIENFLKNKKLKAEDKKELALDTGDIKKLAKRVVVMSGGAVFVGSGEDVYYTGISNLFRQPEFEESSSVYSISEVIDHLDDAISQIFKSIDDSIKILIGHDSPFGDETTTILVRANGKVIGILAPMRMDYENNIALINEVKNILCLTPKN